MLLHLFHFHLGMAAAHTRDVVVDEIEQKIMLRIRQFIVADAGVIQLQIIAKGGGKILTGSLRSDDGLEPRLAGLEIFSGDR